MQTPQSIDPFHHLVKISVQATKNDPEVITMESSTKMQRLRDSIENNPSVCNVIETKQNKIKSRKHDKKMATTKTQ